jgi:hypothetical protein
MKRLQRLEFIFLYEVFLARNKELSNAVLECRSEEEIDGIRKQVDEVYNKIRNQQFMPALSGAMAE